MRIADIIQGDLSLREDLNCAESVFWAANMDLGLGLDPKIRTLASGFGGGMNVGHACGALTGAIMVLGFLYVKDKAHEGERIKEITQRFIARFEEEYGTIMCEPIKEAHRVPVYNCKNVILKSAQILEEILQSDPPENFPLGKN